MNPILTHNSVKPIKYMTVMCLGGAVLSRQGRLWSRTAISTDFPINTFKPPGSAGEPESVQLDSPSARLCFSRVGSGDSGRATHILLFPWCVPPKWKNLTLTIYLACAKKCDRHRRDTEMATMWSSQEAYSLERVRGQVYRVLPLFKALSYNQEKDR